MDVCPIALVETLLGHFPDAPFFMKNTRLEFVAVNAAMVRLCGVKRRADVIGRRSHDFFPAPAPGRFEALDRQVIKSGRPIVDRLDVVLSKGRLVWLMFDRWPILDLNANIVGVAAVAHQLKAPDSRAPTYSRLAAAITQMRETFDRPLKFDAMARRAGVSLSQFERDFVALMGMSPRQYLTKLRMDAAMEHLAGDLPIAAIAQECGYTDQSAFTRRFVAAVGVTPSQFRHSLASQRH